MAGFPTSAALELFAGGVVSTAGSISGLNQVVVSSQAWPSANLAIFVPVRIPYPVTVYKMVVGCGSGTGGNFDVGIYDSSGNKLVSSGATARPGASQEKVVDVTDTVIGPGLYYFALSADGTNTFMMVNHTGASPIPLQKTRLFGVIGMATAYTLPSTATFAAATTGLFPAIAAYLQPT